MLLALDAAWVGVVGTALGGVIGFGLSWILYQAERRDRLQERSRSERKETYSTFLSASEDSMHLFQWLAERHFTPAGQDSDRAAANFFYDREVTPRYMVLKIIGEPSAVEAARALRDALNQVRHLTVDGDDVPAAQSEAFQTAHQGYRKARDSFIERARADLGVQP